MYSDTVIVTLRDGVVSGVFGLADDQDYMIIDHDLEGQDYETIAIDLLYMLYYLTRERKYLDRLNDDLDAWLTQLEQNEIHDPYDLHERLSDECVAKAESPRVPYELPDDLKHL